MRRPVSVGLAVVQKSIIVHGGEVSANGVPLAKGSFVAFRKGSTVVLRNDGGEIVATGSAVVLHATSSQGVSVGKFRVRGEVRLIPEATGVTAVNRLELEDYLKGVVPGEIGRHLSADKFEAVKAQAVVARTYALRKLGMPTGRPYALLATVTDQVYGGLSLEDPLCSKAVEATRSIFLSDGSGPVDAYYHSASGGHTSAIQDAWPNKPARSYLTGIVDSGPAGAWCRNSYAYQWREEWEADDLHRAVARDISEAIGRNVGRLTVTGLRTEGQDPSGRVRRLVVETSSGETLSVAADRIRWALRRNTPGRDILRSTRFTLQRDGDRYVAHGSGNGHGVGMDQWGAMGRAQAGQSFEKILEAYYPGTRLDTLGE
jgi:stage II sporulation protein D